VGAARYRDFMGWGMPWYSAVDSLATLLAAPKQPGRMHLVCYLRRGERVFETYWTTIRGVEAMDYSYALMDLTVYGRQEAWEDSPAGWPRQGHLTRTDGGPPDWPRVSPWPGGRPTAQWPRLAAGCSDDLSGGHPVKKRLLGRFPRPTRRRLVNPRCDTSLGLRASRKLAPTGGRCLVALGSCRRPGGWRQSSRGVSPAVL
jgi:hypothetical protein